MKSAEEILKEKMGETRFNLSGSHEDIISAMKAYAEQAIDRCAEKVKVNFIPGDFEAQVDRNSILNVKSELK